MFICQYKFVLLTVRRYYIVLFHFSYPRFSTSFPQYKLFHSTWNPNMIYWPKGVENCFYIDFTKFAQTSCLQEHSKRPEYRGHVFQIVPGVIGIHRPFVIRFDNKISSSADIAYTTKFTLSCYQTPSIYRTPFSTVHADPCGGEGTFCKRDYEDEI